MEEKESKSKSKKQLKEEQPNNVLHGVNVKEMLVYLIDKLGWEEMGERVRINCFRFNPNMRSSLNFVRKTPWAKELVQQLYAETVSGKLKPLKKKKPIKKWPFLDK
jgi:uncharacterized protein (DUF2132 family)